MAASRGWAGSCEQAKASAYGGGALEAPGIARFTPANGLAAMPAGVAGSLRSLVAGPSDFLVEQTLLGQSDGFRRFLASRPRMDRFMRSSATRMVLGNSVLLRVLARPSVAQAFAATPAMRDPAAVSALVKSPLFRKLCSLGSVKSILNDRSALEGLLAPIAPWLEANPDAKNALRAQSAAAAEAVARLPRGR